jgi:hypothetical protein
MEQAPNLTMASSSAPPSPMPGLTSTTPTPDQPDLTQTEARTPPATAASPAGTLPANQPATTTGVQTTVERAFQHGLNRANLEQEVGQVMGTLSGWWGGVKKQVSDLGWLDASYSFAHFCSLLLPSRVSRQTLTRR